MNRSIFFVSIFALALGLVLSAPTGAADEKDDKAKMNEKEKEKVKEKKEKKEEVWTSLFTVSSAPGGFQHFDLPKNSKVKFTWETTPDGQVPQFRVTVAKLNDRTGSYQTQGTVVSTKFAEKKSAGMLLAAGKYRLYIATKFMKYTLTVEGQEP